MSKRGRKQKKVFGVIRINQYSISFDIDSFSQTVRETLYLSLGQVLKDGHSKRNGLSFQNSFFQPLVQKINILRTLTTFFESRKKK